MKSFRLLFITLICLTGCTVTGDKPNIPEEAYAPEATLGATTKTAKMLLDLPAPAVPVTLSVYEFEDQTGQNKPGDSPQYSRAVTQGALSIVKKALLDAGSHTWFRVLERGGLDNLLQERKIIRAMRGEYLGPNSEKLPPVAPLLYSGVLLEGGIIAYESNVMTGGVGARYLGIGGSENYSRDMVTIYLRLISVKTGEVLLSVNSSKTIYSTGLSGGVYMFVSYDKLAESELGYTLNEPPQLAVRQAIELGVYAMVMEGYKNGLWNFKNSELGQEAFIEYAKNYLGIKDQDKLKIIRQQLASRLTAIVAKATSSLKKEKVLKRQDTQEVVVKRSKKLEPNKKERVVKKSVKKAEPQKRKRTNAKKQKSNGLTALEQIPEGWYVHVLAVRSVGQTEEEILNQLMTSGLPVLIQKAAVATIPYYRILVGAYESRKLAEDVRNQLLSISTKMNAQIMKQHLMVTKH